MNRTDRAATTRVVTWIVAAVALFAAGDSYVHIFDLAREHGPGGVPGVISAALLPLAGDGVVAAASAAMLAAARNRKTVPLRARLTLVAGLANDLGERGLRASSGHYRGPPGRVACGGLLRRSRDPGMDAGAPGYLEARE